MPGAIQQVFGMSINQKQIRDLFFETAADAASGGHEGALAYIEEYDAIYRYKVDGSLVDSPPDTLLAGGTDGYWVMVPSKLNTLLTSALIKVHSVDLDVDLVAGDNYNVGYDLTKADMLIIRLEDVPTPGRPLSSAVYNLNDIIDGQAFFYWSFSSAYLTFKMIDKASGIVQCLEEAGREAKLLGFDVLKYGL